MVIISHKETHVNKKTRKSWQKFKPWFQDFQKIFLSKKCQTTEDNYEEIKEALVPNDYNLIVTPKEIDDLIENMKDIVAGGINSSL